MTLEVSIERMLARLATIDECIAVVDGELARWKASAKATEAINPAELNETIKPGMVSGVWAALVVLQAHRSKAEAELQLLRRAPRAQAEVT